MLLFSPILYDRAMYQPTVSCQSWRACQTNQNNDSQAVKPVSQSPDLHRGHHLTCFSQTIQWGSLTSFVKVNSLEIAPIWKGWKEWKSSSLVQTSGYSSSSVTSESDLDCSINIDLAAPHHLLLHLPNEDHFDHAGADHLPPPSLTLPLHFCYKCRL